MSATSLQNMIVPEVFADYVTKLTAEKSALYQSGVAVSDPVIAAKCNAGGAFVHLPYFNDLTGDAEVMSDTGELELNAITAEEDVAVKCFRAKAWGSTDLVAAMVGADPVQALANQIASYWARQEQKALIATLTGVFGGALASTHVHDVTTGNTALSAEVVLDSKQLLGDSGDSIVAIAMHSAKYTALQKQNLIAFIPASEANVRIPTYLGYRVIVDDGCPVDQGDYTSYLFAAGAVAHQEVAVPNMIEFDRYSLKSQDVMITRAGFITHVRGVKWNTTDSNPSNAGLATANKWAKVYDDKQIRVVKILSK